MIRHINLQDIGKFFALITVFLLLLGTVIQPVRVLALSEEDIHAINIDSVWHKTYPIVSCSASSTSLSGSDNEQKIWNYFIGKGLTPVQTAGFMGNMQAESHFEPKLVEYGFPNSRGEISVAGQPSSLDDNVPPDANSHGQPGYGIVQWSGGRKPPLKDAAVAAGKLASDLGLQLDNLWRELTTSYSSSVYDPLKATNDLNEATRIVLANFEVPGDIPGQTPIRQGMAADILGRLGSSSVVGAPSGLTVGSSCSSSSSNGTTGGYSLPVDKKFYDEHKDWFTKPHGGIPAADIPVPPDTPVYSMSAGKIIAAPTSGDCGMGIEIDAGGGVRFIYCHGSDGGSVDGAKNGDTVKPGQLIMHSDNTGKSTGSHLHLGIRVNGRNLCPQSFFVGIAEGKIPDITTLPSSGCTN